MQQKFDLENTNKSAASLIFSKTIDYDFPKKRDGWRGMGLVGEAPGADEVKLGHPFVGRSGQLLNKILAEAKIDRADCLIANVFRMQPAANKVDHFFISRRKAKEQHVALAEQYGPFGSAWCRADFIPELEQLRKTLEKMKPSIVVSLGRTPLWALTGENGLMDRVGKVIPSTLVPGLKIMPTFHPSFIMRGNWGLQAKWLEHLLAANQYVA